MKQKNGRNALTRPDYKAQRAYSTLGRIPQFHTHIKRLVHGDIIINMGNSTINVFLTPLFSTYLKEIDPYHFTGCMHTKKFVRGMQQTFNLGIILNNNQLSLAQCTQHVNDSGSITTGSQYHTKKSVWWKEPMHTPMVLTQHWFIPLIWLLFAFLLENLSTCSNLLCLQPANFTQWALPPDLHLTQNLRFISRARTLVASSELEHEVACPFIRLDNLSATAHIKTPFLYQQQKKHSHQDADSTSYDGDAWQQI